jgi:hypothetical protein
MLGSALKPTKSQCWNNHLDSVLWYSFLRHGSLFRISKYFQPSLTFESKALAYLLRQGSKVLPLRMIQLPVFATRWQHMSQICFETFIWLNIAILSITQLWRQLEKNKHRFRILRILEVFWCMLDKINKKQVNFT